jgi:hypothetical protein
MSKCRPQLTVVLTDELRAFVEDLAKREDRSIGAAIRRILAQAQREQAAQPDEEHAA